MNDLNYNQITIEMLKMSNRVTNALRRTGISTLAELLTAYEQGKLYDISYLGKKSYEEIEQTLEKVANGEFQFEEIENDETDTAYEVSEEFENIPISELKISERLYNALIRGGFDTVGKLLRMTRDDVTSIREMEWIGTKTVKR